MSKSRTRLTKLPSPPAAEGLGEEGGGHDLGDRWRAKEGGLVSAGLMRVGLAIGTLLGFGIFALQQRRNKAVPQTNTPPQRRQEMTQAPLSTITSMSDLRLFFHRLLILITLWKHRI